MDVKPDSMAIYDESSQELIRLTDNLEIGERVRSRLLNIAGIIPWKSRIRSADQVFYALSTELGDCSGVNIIYEFLNTGLPLNHGKNLRCEIKGKSYRVYVSDN